MRSVECFVINEDVYFRTEDEDIILDIKLNFEVFKVNEGIYRINPVGDIREFLEKNQYPYSVTTDDYEAAVSRTWKPNIEPNLTSVSGLDDSKSLTLKRNGIVTVDDLRATDQKDLAEIDSIGNALAARVKADVGSINL